MPESVQKFTVGNVKNKTLEEDGFLYLCTYLYKEPVGTTEKTIVHII